MQFYLCGDCNTSSQHWASWSLLGSRFNGVPMYYDVTLTGAGDFQVTATRVDNGSIVANSVFSKPSWMPDLSGDGGYITAVFQARKNNPAFYNSYLDLWSILVYSDQCQ